MLRFIFIVLVLCDYNNIFSQSQHDFNNCLLQLIKFEKYEEIFFSFKDEDLDKDILCVQARSLKCENIAGDFYTDRLFFEENFNNLNEKLEDGDRNKNKRIFVESSAFIHSYEVPFWMVIDSIKMEKEYFTIFIQTTSFSKLNEYEYVSGVFYFENVEEDWILVKDEMIFDTYKNPYSWVNLDSIRVNNLRMIQEAKMKMGKK